MYDRYGRARCTVDVRVAEGVLVFGALESTQKFTADGVAHSSIPGLRSNDEAGTALGPGIFAAPGACTLVISRILPFFSCHGVTVTRVERTRL